DDRGTGVRTHPGTEPGQRLLHRELPDGPALRVVRVEQPGAGRAREYLRELPGEVVRVLDATVRAKAAGRRPAVRGVAAQEPPCGPVAAGDPGGDREGQHRPVCAGDLRLQGDLDIVESGGRADHAGDPVVVVRVQVFVLRVVAGAEDPFLPVQVVRHQDRE